MATLKERLTRVEVKVEDHDDDIKQVNKKLWWMGKSFVGATITIVTGVLIGIIMFIINKYL